ncbi:MAG: PAS domain S-box protein [Thermoanaerobaculia bacterium]|nr:PAS domain S-box protein [Thermoanaerobaculia bacterium]
MAREPELSAQPDPQAGPADAAAFFELAFDHSPVAIVVAQDGLIVAANAAAARFSGRAAAQLLGQAFLDMIHPEDATRIAERYRRRLAGDALDDQYTFRVLAPDGSVRWFDAESRRIDWRRRPAVLSYLFDVTEREGQRRQVAELSHLLERIADVSPYFIFVYDYEQGRDVYINRPVPRALGYSEEDAAALEPYPFEKLCHPDDLRKAMDRDERWREVPDGVVDAVEFRMRNRDGDWRWFRSLNTPFLRDSHGRVRQMLGVCTDITELRRSEEALRRSEKLEGIGLLAGGLAHDFGNLLTPIVGHAELLARKLDGGTPLRSHVDAIRQASERAAELVQQLLVVAGRGEFAPRAVELDALVVEVAAMLEPVLPHEVALSTELAPDLPPVAGDPMQLRQVILNLVGNASDALAGRGGTIVVRALAVDVDETLASLLELRERFAPGPAVLLEVEDDGPGMDEATRARLLEPFFTTKPKGRGLGLASVVGIVRRHRGGLAVDSNPGRGTIFRILLPLATRPVDSPAPAP